MAVLCDLTFPTDLSEFTSTIDTEGDMVWDGTASGSPDGSTGCVKIIIDNTTAACGIKSQAVIGSTPTDIQAASYWDFGDLALATDDQSVMIWSVRTASAAISSVSIVRTSGALYLRHAIIADSAGPTGQTEDIAMAGAVPLRLALWIHKATNATSEDGYSKLYARGGDYADSWTMISDLLGVDIFTNFENCSQIRPGATNVGTGISATNLLFDRIQWNTDTDLLDFSAPPTADIVVPPGDVEIFENDVLNLEGAASGGATPYKNWSWSVVEASSGTTPVATQTGTMAFPNDGTWTLQLTVDGDDDLTSDPVTITVTVSAVANAAPVITSNGGGATAAISIAEGTTTVTTVVATDADETTPTYSISGGADQALFTIGTASGVLLFTNAPDFENPLDAGANNVYEVTVQASDGIATDTQTISVTVTKSTKEARQYTYLQRRRRRS